jgi:hypothetical protein
MLWTTQQCRSHCSTGEVGSKSIQILISIYQNKYHITHGSNRNLIHFLSVHTTVPKTLRITNEIWLTKVRNGGKSLRWNSLIKPAFGNMVVMMHDCSPLNTNVVRKSIGNHPVIPMAAGIHDMRLTSIYSQ